MLKIFVDTHKIIAGNVYDNVFKNYGIKLDKKKLLWGSISPDILPQYKLQRHYKSDSLDYVVREIMKIIFIGRYLDFNKSLDPFTMRIISNKIGVVSHYLSDFVCIPHAKRWTFTDGIKTMIKHVKYESKLNDKAASHDFKNNILNNTNINIKTSEPREIKSIVEKYLEDVIEEYSIKEGFKNDLNFASSLNIKIAFFVFETIESYNEEFHREFAFNL